MHRRGQALVSYRLCTAGSTLDLAGLAAAIGTIRSLGIIVNDMPSCGTYDGTGWGLTGDMMFVDRCDPSENQSNELQPDIPSFNTLDASSPSTIHICTPCVDVLSETVQSA